MNRFNTFRLLDDKGPPKYSWSESLRIQAKPFGLLLGLVIVGLLCIGVGGGVNRLLAASGIELTIPLFIVVIIGLFLLAKRILSGKSAYEAARQASAIAREAREVAWEASTAAWVVEQKFIKRIKPHYADLPLAVQERWNARTAAWDAAWAAEQEFIKSTEAHYVNLPSAVQEMWNARAAVWDAANAARAAATIAREAAKEAWVESDAQDAH